MQKLEELLAYDRVTETLKALLERPGYRTYLWNKLNLWKKFKRRTGYNCEQWVRVVYSQEWQRLCGSLPLQSLSVLEISPGPHPVLEVGSVAQYRAVNFPDFDITQDVLPEDSISS